MSLCRLLYFRCDGITVLQAFRARHTYEVLPGCPHPAALSAMLCAQVAAAGPGGAFNLPPTVLG